MLKNIDQFGQPYRLNFNKNQRTRTTLGAIMTMFYILLLLCFFWFTGTELVFKNKPRIIQSTIQRENPSPFRGTLGFRLEYGDEIIDNFWQYLESKIFFVSNTTNTFELDLSLTSSLKNTINSDQNLYKLEDLFQNYENFLENIHYFSLAFSPCRNSTMRNFLCKPEEEILTVLKNLKINFFYENTLRQFNNFSFPVQNFLSTDVIKIDEKMTKFIEYKYDILNLMTDKGIMFSNIISVNYETLTSKFLDIYSKKSSEEELLIIKIISGEKEEINMREYLKLNDLLPFIYCIVTISFNLFSFLLRPIYDKLMNDTLIRELFIINNEEIMKEIESNIQVNNVKVESTKSQNATSKIDTSNTPIVETNRMKSLNLNVVPTTEDKVEPKEFNIAEISKHVSHPEYNNLEGFSQFAANFKVEEETPYFGKRKNSVVSSNRIPTPKSHKDHLHNSSTELKIVLLDNKQDKSFYRSTDLFCYCLFKFLLPKRKKNLYNYNLKMQKFVEEYSDILRISQNVNEVEKIKLLIFNLPQLAYFNNYSKLENPMKKEGIKKITEHYRLIKDPDSLKSNLSKFSSSIELSYVNSSMDTKLKDMLFKANQ